MFLNGFLETSRSKVTEQEYDLVLGRTDLVQAGFIEMGRLQHWQSRSSKGTPCFCPGQSPLEYDTISCVLGPPN